MVWQMAAAAAVQGIGGYLTSKSNAKYEQKMIEYQNSVNRANYITQSSALQSSKVESDRQIAAANTATQQEHMLNEGAANVAAAVAGATGNSVTQSMVAIDQAAASKFYNLDIAENQAEQQFLNNQVALEMQLTGSFIPDAVQPDLLVALGTSAASAASAYYSGSK